MLRRNVLIFHSGALGDFILTWPLALALGRLFPQSRIFYVTAGQKGLLAERVLRVESVDVESGWHHLFAEAPALPEAAAKRLFGAHCVFTFVAGPDSTWTRNVAGLAPEAQILSLSQSPPADFTGHVSNYLVEQLKLHPAWAEALRQMLQSVAGRGVSAIPPGGVPVLHPGSGSGHKNWPAGHFLRLAERLSADGRRPRIILGDVEQERWAPAEIDALAAVGELHRPGDLVGLLQALSGAGLFVGNDSGPGHLAAIAGIPTISLFGPTDPDRWRPLGPRVRVLRRNPLTAIDVDEVYRAGREMGTRVGEPNLKTHGREMKA